MINDINDIAIPLNDIKNNEIHLAVINSIKSYKHNNNIIESSLPSKPTVFNVDNLISQPIWILPYITNKLSSNIEVIKNEYLHLITKKNIIPIEIKNNILYGKWFAYNLMEEGVINNNIAQICPKTVEILNELPICKSIFGYSYFSKIKKGTRITSHYGVTNSKLRIQFPIIGCDRCDIIINDVTYKYEYGVPIVFDDTYKHEVINYDEDDRIVLIIDIWHPDLDILSINEINKFFNENNKEFNKNNNNITIDKNNQKLHREYDYLLKFLMIGDHSVGKSKYLLRLADSDYNKNYISTIGVDFKIKKFQIDNKVVKIQIWDPAGPERFRTITSSYYRGANGIILMYDVTNRDSFETINFWYNEFKRNSADNCKCILMGNQIDCEDDYNKQKERQVSYQEGLDLSIKLGINFFETSAKLNVNIEEPVLSLAYDIIKDLPIRPYVKKVEVNSDSNHKIKSKCNIM